MKKTKRRGTHEPGIVLVAALCSIPVAILAQSASLPTPSHIVIVIEENKSYSDVIGSKNAPYINALANAARSSRLSTQRIIQANPTTLISSRVTLSASATIRARSQRHRSPPTTSVPRFSQLRASHSSVSSENCRHTRTTYAGRDVHEEALPVARLFSNILTSASKISRSSTQRKRALSTCQQ